MGRRAARREDSAARLRALTRRAYTASSGHLDLDEDAGREFDRIVQGGPADDTSPPAQLPTRRWIVSLRAAVVVLAVVAALTGVVVVRSLAAGSAPITVPELEASGEDLDTGGESGHGQQDGPARGDDGAHPAPGSGTGQHDGGGGAPSDDSGTGGSPSTVADTTTPPSLLAVHVAGAVTAPGVVELPDGARVAQAIEAAGGASADAELAAINLARPVEDGEQVYVPVVGEAEPGTAAGTVTSGQPRAVPEGSSVVDLNTADSAGLESLPGIGPAIAQRILDWRAANGPFHSVDELLEVSGIGPATLERLRDRVRV